MSQFRIVSLQNDSPNYEYISFQLFSSRMTSITINGLIKTACDPMPGQ
jgi:hypothetical protein